MQLLFKMRRKCSSSHAGLQEPNQLDDIDEPILNASVHGAITSLSPIKKSHNANFFDGTIADESCKLWFVGFNSDQLNIYFVTWMPIHIKAREAREGYKMEVMFKSATQIVQSPKTIDTSAIDPINTDALCRPYQPLSAHHYTTLPKSECWS